MKIKPTAGTFYRCSLFVLLAAAILMLPGAAKAQIQVVTVGATELLIDNALGADYFSIDDGNSGTAYYFGNFQELGENLNTADRVPFNTIVGPQYFQDDSDVSNPYLGSTGSTRAYWFDSVPNSGAVAGINYSLYDANQNGLPDTLFQLDFGPDLSDVSDDLIVAYAYDTSPTGIDIAAARALLAIPEPASAVLAIASTALLVWRIRRR